MRRFKQWAIDVGLWQAESVETWTWWRFRPRFWRTSSNLTHRTYRAVIKALIDDNMEAVRKAYVQGAQDATLQVLEYQQLSGDEVPKEWYPN